MSEVKSEVRGVAKLSVPCNSKKPVKIGAEFHEADDLQSLLMSASIFKGNSGGPVISESDGKVVGIIYKGCDPSLESAPTEAIPASYLKALNSN